MAQLGKPANNWKSELRFLKPGTKQRFYHDKRARWLGGAHAILTERELPAEDHSKVRKKQKLVRKQLEVTGKKGLWRNRI